MTLLSNACVGQRPATAAKRQATVALLHFTAGLDLRIPDLWLIKVDWLDFPFYTEVHYL